MGLHGVACDCMWLHGVAWDCMGLYVTAWDCVGLHGTAWGCMGLHGIAWDWMGLHVALLLRLSWQSVPMPLVMWPCGLLSPLNENTALYHSLFYWLQVSLSPDLSPQKKDLCTPLSHIFCWPLANYISQSSSSCFLFAKYAKNVQFFQPNNMKLSRISARNTR